jgi:hypothetical protein
VNELLKSEKLKHFMVTPWKPIFHDADLQHTEAPNLTFAVVQPENAYFLLFHPFHSMNLGHFIWDDLLSLFSLLDLFDLAQDENIQPVPLFVEFTNQRKQHNYGGDDTQYRCSPKNLAKWVLCVKTFRKFYPQLFGIKTDCTGDILRTGNWLRGEENIGAWKSQEKVNCTKHMQKQRTNLPPENAEYVLLPNVLAGTGRLGQFGCSDDCSLGRAPQFYRFREFMMRHLYGSQTGCLESRRGPVGHIVFSLPVGSSRANQVLMFEEEIESAKAKYGDDVVRVVNMANITMQEQATILSNAAVFLTNHGGGGAVSTFLQRGTGVLNFWHGAYRFDHPFYDLAGYFRTTWVSKGEAKVVNRTMALIDLEVERTAMRWPNIVAFKGRQ